MGKVSQDELWPVLKTGDRDIIEAKYGNVMAALSHGLRGAITATPGKTLFVADYANIEARVVLWLGRDKKALETFVLGANCPCRALGKEGCPDCDPYCGLAQTVFHRMVYKTDHPKERGVGKEGILGLGFQMGCDKFADRCAAAGMPMPVEFMCEVCGEMERRHRKIKDHAMEIADPDAVTALKVVNAYREKFWRVKAMWSNVEEAAIAAIEDPGEVYSTNRVHYYTEGKFLYCELPSGRRLAYPFPSVGKQRTDWGEERPQIRYYGVDSYTHQWRRQTAYGGMLVENNTQAVARDILAEAFVRCEASGVYVPVLTVHDENIAEADEGKGNVKEFEELVSEVPTWAKGLPIAAEAWSGFRYHK